MSGSLYQYTPYQGSGQPESPGQAFRSGFAGGQAIETNAMRMDEMRQLAQMRELQEQRAQEANQRQTAEAKRNAQLFPLQLQQAEFNLQQAQRLGPIAVQQAQFNLDRLRRAYANEQATGTAVTGYLRDLAPPPAQAPTPAVPAAAPQAAPNPATYFIPFQAPTPAAPAAAPATPAAPTAVTPGPQTELRPSWMSPAPYARAPGMPAGVQLASAGLSDYTGMPTGYQPAPNGAEEEAFANIPRVPARPAFPEFPAPPVGMPERSAVQPSITGAGGTVYPFAQPTDNDPVIFGRPLSSYTLQELERLQPGATPVLRSAGRGAATGTAGGARRFDPETGAIIQTPQDAIGQRIAVLRARTAEPFPEEPLTAAPAAAVSATAPAPAAASAAAPAAAAAAPGTQVAPTGPAAAAAPGTQEAPTREAGVTPPGERNFQQIQEDIANRINRLTQEAPAPVSPLDAVQVNREEQVLSGTVQTLAAREQALVARERDLNARVQLAQRLAQSNPQAAMQIAQAVTAERNQIIIDRNAIAVERQAANLLQANLNGRRAIISAASGNFEPLARDIHIASGNVLRLRQRQDGNFDILGGPNERDPLATNVSRDQMIAYGRQLYDNNYRTQMEAIRTRGTEVRRAVMDAAIKGLEESFTQQAAASREIAVNRAKAAAEAANRSPNVQARLSTDGNTITYTDAAGVVPDRILRLTQQDIRGQRVWVFVPVEAAPRPTQ
jgi:hypothetical protein